MNTTTVELAEVTKSYGSTRALDRITLTLGRGVTGLLGPNGAGKTTLLRIIATVLAPDDGVLPGSWARTRATRRGASRSGAGSATSLRSPATTPTSAPSTSSTTSPS